MQKNKKKLYDKNRKLCIIVCIQYITNEIKTKKIAEFTLSSAETKSINCSVCVCFKKNFYVHDRWLCVHIYITQIE